MLIVARDITDTKQAQDALKRRVAELEALYQTSLQTAAQGDLPALLELVVESAARLTGGDRGALYLPTPDGARLRLHISFNLGKDYTGTEVELGEGVAGRAALERRVIMVEDYTAWEGSSPRFHDKGFGRILAVPMVVGDRLVGVLSVARPQHWPVRRGRDSAGEPACRTSGDGDRERPAGRRDHSPSRLPGSAHQHGGGAPGGGHATRDVRGRVGPSGRSASS